MIRIPGQVNLASHNISLMTLKVVRDRREIADKKWPVVSKSSPFNWRCLRLTCSTDFGSIFSVGHIVFFLLNRWG